MEKLKTFVIILIINLSMLGCVGYLAYDNYQEHKQFGAYIGGLTDSTTGARVNIDYHDYAKHKGDTFTLATSTDIAAGAYFDLMIEVGDVELHMFPTAEVEAESILYIYEGGTVSASGTALTIYNDNRTSDITSDVDAYYAPTITTEGTALREKHVGSGKTIGGEARTNGEIILKPETVYLFRVLNNSVSTGWISPDLTWSEL